MAIDKDEKPRTGEMKGGFGRRAFGTAVFGEQLGYEPTKDEKPTISATKDEKPTISATKDEKPTI